MVIKYNSIRIQGGKGKRMCVRYTCIGEPVEYRHPAARLEINPHYGTLDRKNRPRMERFQPIDSQKLVAVGR